MGKKKETVNEIWELLDAVRESRVGIKLVLSLVDEEEKLNLGFPSLGHIRK